MHPLSTTTLGATEQNKNPATRTFSGVVSDLENRIHPIAEENVTRYDILAGRGGKTNAHEVPKCVGVYFCCLLHGTCFF